MIRRIMRLTTVLAMAAVVHAQSGGDYAIVWNTIDGGGGESSGGQYGLIGTVGQPDSGWCRGGNYEVLGGFWPGDAPCIVEFHDFAKFADLWLVGDPAAKGDGYGGVGFSALSWFADYWLSYCPHPWPFK